jgi:hypothetical protein
VWVKRRGVLEGSADMSLAEQYVPNLAASFVLASKKILMPDRYNGKTIKLWHDSRVVLNTDLRKHHKI